MVKTRRCAHGRPSEMANIKRGSTEQNPRDCFHQENTRADERTIRHKEVEQRKLCSEARALSGGTGGAGLLTCVVIYLGHKGTQQPLPQDRGGRQPALPLNLG